MVFVGEAGPLQGMTQMVAEVKTVPLQGMAQSRVLMVFVVALRSHQGEVQ